MAEYALKTEKINKYFDITHANIDVSIEVKKGEIRGVAGENGSGKSTLLSMVAGIQPKSSGEMYVFGKPYNPETPMDAYDAGISIVVQEMGLISTLPAGVNVFLGRTQQFTKGGIVNLKQIYKTANEGLKKWDMPELPLNIIPGNMSVEMQKMVEIGRALSVDPQILILDEVTQALSHDNRERLKGLIRRFKEDGRTIILITHDLEELMEISDSITIMRDGEVVDTVQTSECSLDELKRMMIGREMSGHYYREDDVASFEDEVVMHVENMSADNEIEDISFDVHKGEILGFCGLSDSGIHTVGRALYGLSSKRAGTVELRLPGKTVDIKNQTVALQNDMAYIPKDRAKEALMFYATIKENMCIASYDDLVGKLGYLSEKKMNDLSERAVKEFDVKTTGINQLTTNLSGGNKQKINLARWLLKDLNLLILDCPTRGVDVGVKQAIYTLIESEKEKGRAIVLISDELPEVLGMADRLIVMKNGRMVKELTRGKDVSLDTIMEVML